MVADNSFQIGLSIDPLTFVLHPIATFGMISSSREFNYLRVRPLVSLCLRYGSSVTGIFPLLGQLRGLRLRIFHVTVITIVMIVTIILIVAIATIIMIVAVITILMCV